MMKNIIHFLEDTVRSELKGCIIPADNGVSLYTPDGVGNYHALWTRDFSYMVEYAGEFIPTEDILAGLSYLLDHTRSTDGWIPDRVYKDGEAVYAAGSVEHPCGEANLDNGPFLCLIMDNFLKRISPENAHACFLKWENQVLKGLNVIPKNQDGLVYNQPEKPHSPYGFTDCIRKTGALMMESLLLWRGYGVLAYWQLKCNRPTATARTAMEKIEAHLVRTFLNSDSMLNAATVDCRQTDVWGSCYAVSIGFPLGEALKRAIASWLISNYEGIVQKGQVRHTAPGTYWEQCLVTVKKGEYQNGAYWATATGWLIDAIMAEDLHLAEKTLMDATAFFHDIGLYECVNDDCKKLAHYVVSATNCYPAAKKLFPPANQELDPFQAYG